MRPPFSQARWEHDSEHLFYLPREQFLWLQEAKPTYLVGTRGTGKTTLLKALNWRERLTNRSLQRQLRELSDSSDLFSAHCVGVYFKLPRVQLDLFDQLLGEDDPLYTNAVSLYLGLNWVDLMAEAVIGLLEAEVFTFSSDDERDAVARICEYFADTPGAGRYLDSANTRTLRSLAKGLRQVRRSLERDLQTGASASELAAEYPIGQLAEFADFAGHELVGLFPVGDGEPWYFLVCMDEGESLSESQQLAVNSLIRVAERPVLPVVACLTLPSPLTSTAGNMTTTNADVDVIAIDTMDRKEFREFAEGVASVRLQEATGNEVLRVTLDKLVGPLQINKLLERIIRGSTDPWGRYLLAEAEGNKGLPYFGEESADAPPIYQTFLVRELDLTVPSEDAAHWEARGQSSAEIRKKMAAAYLTICSRLRVNPLYASSSMLLGMSDKCVRDFLWQMHELYMETSATPGAFAKKSNIPVTSQDVALRRASNNKINRVGDFVLAETSTVSRLVDGLGVLTARLQRPSEAQLIAGYTRQLRSNEPGVFRIQTDDRSNPGYPEIADLIQEAIEASYLRRVSKVKEALKFRVHSSLAAHYEFSYRGAYSETVLMLDEVRALCIVTDEIERGNMIDRIVARITQSGDPSGTLSLLEDLADEP